MPRSREIDIEQDRANSTNIAKSRPDAKSGTGPAPRERKGFGSEKGMQANPKNPSKQNQF